MEDREDNDTCLKLELDNGYVGAPRLGTPIALPNECTPANDVLGTVDPDFKFIKELLPVLVDRLKPLKDRFLLVSPPFSEQCLPEDSVGCPDMPFPKLPWSEMSFPPLGDPFLSVRPVPPENEFWLPESRDFDRASLCGLSRGEPWTRGTSRRQDD